MSDPNFRSSPLGALHSPPDVVVLGTQKGGTTELFRRLALHPEFQPSSEKEIHFFDREENWQLGVNWYHSQFETRSVLNGRLTGEATPAYLFHECVPERAATVLDPSCRFVVLLREPVDRALSHFVMEVRRNQESESFEVAVNREMRDFSSWRRSALDESSDAYLRYSYLHRGLYHEQLRRWFTWFDRDRFLILRAESFFERPATVTAEVWRFLGLSADHDAGPDISHATRTSLSTIPVPAFVPEFFREDREQLAKLVGIDW